MPVSLKNKKKIKTAKNSPNKGKKVMTKKASQGGNAAPKRRIKHSTGNGKPNVSTLSTNSPQKSRYPKSKNGKESDPRSKSKSPQPNRKRGKTSSKATKNKGKTTTKFAVKSSPTPPKTYPRRASSNHNGKDQSPTYSVTAKSEDSSPRPRAGYKLSAYEPFKDEKGGLATYTRTKESQSEKGGHTKGSGLKGSGPRGRKRRIKK